MRQLFATGLAAAALLAAAAPAAAFTVNRTSDEPDAALDGACDTDAGTAGPQCTLRAAIQESNNSPGTHDTIDFAIGTGTQTIGLTSDLPAITDGATIDGYTQDGAAVNTNAGFTAFNAVIHVNVDGNDHVTFVVTGGGTTIRGLRIYDSGANGVLLDSSVDQPGGNHVEGNVVGVPAVADPTDEHNRGAGVAVYGGDGNTIGGSTAAKRNVISGNGEPLDFDPNFPGYGVHVRGDSDATSVQGNLIGVDATGIAALPNAGSAVRVGGFTTGPNPVNTSATNTIVGGTAAGTGNVLSANGVSPLEAWGVFVGPAAGAGVKILGNRIGTNVSGTAALGNNPDGIELLNDAPVQVGDAAGHGNLISGNVSRGVVVNSAGDTLQGNRIGTNAAGTAALPNANAGVYVNGQANSQIGGTTVGARNLISGNGAQGIEFAQDATGNRVQGNFIGTDATGAAGIQNGGDGIEFNGGDGNLVGAAGSPPAGTGGGNLISGNGGAGVALTQSESGSADGNTIAHNAIGTKAGGTGAIANDKAGVAIDGGSHNRVGGVSAGNVIAHNGGPGIEIAPGVQTPASGNPISRNSIFANGGLGIELLPKPGITPNDGDDPDDGPNLLQNFPVLSSAITGGGTTTVQGTLNSVPTHSYRIELFDNAACDASGNGEGATYLGAKTVATNAAGDATFSATVATSVAVGHPVTATATTVGGATAGDTSEFSRCVAATKRKPSGGGKPPPPKCTDHKRPVSVLRARDVRSSSGRRRIVGPTGIKIRGRSRDPKPCRSGVKEVLVSLARVRGRGGTQCRFLKDPDRYDLTPRVSCHKPILFRVKGKRHWHFSFGAQLKPGLYRIRVRAYDRAGNKERPAHRNGVFFTIHR